MFSSLVRRRTRRCTTAFRPNPPPRFRPQVEALEDRVLLSLSPLTSALPLGATVSEIAVVGTAGNDTLAVTATGPDRGTYTLNNGPPIPLNGVTRFSFAGMDGNDTLSINNPTGGLFAPPGGIFFDGGGQPGDTLTLAGINATTVTNTFLPDSGGTPHSGVINLDGTIVQYAGLQPVNLGGTIANLVINLPQGDGDNQAILEDNGIPSDGLSQVRSRTGTFETTAFPSPTGSLTVNTGGDGETVTLARLDITFLAPITVSGTGPDTLRVDFSSGSNVIPTNGITLNGTGKDALVLVPGYAAQSVTDNYTKPGSGNINIDGRTITFNGLGPTPGISDRLAAASRTFNFPDTNDNVTLGDDPLAGNGISRIASLASSPTTDFSNPKASLTVNLGNGADVILAGPLDAVNPPATVNLNGLNGTLPGPDGGDTFNITPSPATTFNVDGDQPPPPPPGDTLNVNTNGTTLPFPVFINTPTGLQGNFTFGNRMPVNFQEIEKLSPLTADLSITKDDNQTTAVPGTTITYTIVATNNGPIGVKGVRVTDLFPVSPNGFTSVSFKRGFSSPNSGSNAPGTGTGDIDQLVNLAAGDSVTYIVTATIDPSARGALSNTATVTPPPGVPDANGTNNSATDVDQLKVLADVAVTKTDSPDPVVAGQTLTYSITVTNNGPQDAQNVVVTDQLPGQTTFQSATSSQGAGVNNNGTVTFKLGTLASGGTATATIVVMVDANTPAGSLILNTANALSPTPDPDPNNNVAMARTTTTITSRADLAVTKTAPATVLAGQDLTYTLAVMNNGPNDAQGVTLSDAVPAGTTFVSFSQSTGPAFTLVQPLPGGPATVHAAVATLAVGAGATFTLVVHANDNDPGQFTILNTATVASNSPPDPNPANNTATFSTTVQVPPAGNQPLPTVPPAPPVVNTTPDAATLIALARVSAPAPTVPPVVPPGGSDPFFFLRFSPFALGTTVGLPRELPLSAVGVLGTGRKDTLGEISGLVFQDLNGNGFQDPGEPSLPGQIVFLDVNDNGIPDPWEPRMETDSQGKYLFSGLALTRHKVRQDLRPLRLRQTLPQENAAHVIELTPDNSSIAGKDFGVRILPASRGASNRGTPASLPDPPTPQPPVPQGGGQDSKPQKDAPEDPES